MKHRKLKLRFKYQNFLFSFAGTVEYQCNLKSINLKSVDLFYNGYSKHHAFIKETFNYIVMFIIEIK